MSKHAQDAAGPLQVIERNIEALLERERRAQVQRSLADRIADAVTRFAGSMPFVYIHAALVAAWVIVNLGWTPLRPFDPTFVVLAMLASVEAIFLSTFVLITQNRMQIEANRRADLDLQVNMLAEYKLTRMTKLLTSLAERSGIDVRKDPELRELQEDVPPGQVLDTIETKRSLAENDSRV